MTEEQRRARDTIAIYEGASRITCDYDGRTLVVDTDTGSRWRVDTDAKRIEGPNGRLYDSAELETRISHPEIWQADEFNDPYPYPEAPPPPVRLATDEDWERAEDLERSGRAERELQAYWDRLERRVTF